MTVEEITAEIRRFRDERDLAAVPQSERYGDCHLAEASELLEHFLWINSEDSAARADSRRQANADEIADIAIYLFELANNVNIDLLPAMSAKLASNAVKYPVGKAKGRSDKYNEL